MTDHYQTLGVARDASPDEIRAAYRRAAQAAHPDKGGSTERMQAINLAHEVLSDPERRAQYDRTGVDVGRDQVEQQARDALIQLFQAAIEHSETVLADVRAMIAEHRVRLMAEVKSTAARAAKLQKRSGKIRVKHGDNLAQGLIDNKIRGAHGDLEQLMRGLEVNARAAEMLLAYEEDAPVPSGTIVWASPFTPYETPR